MSRVCKLLVCIVAIHLLIPATVLGQELKATPTLAAEARSEDLAKKRHTIKEQLDSFQNPTSGPLSEFDQRRIDLLQRLYTIVGQRENQQAHLTESEERISEHSAVKEAGKVSIPSTFSALEELTIELTLISEKVAKTKQSIIALETTLDEARQTYRESEAKRRKIKEGGIKGDAQMAIAELESQVAVELLKLREGELAVERLELRAQQFQFQHLESEHSAIKKRVRFAKQELDKYILDLDQDAIRLREKLAVAQAELGAAQRGWDAARKNGESGSEPFHADKVVIERLSVVVAQEKLDLLSKELQRISDRKDLWSKRFKVYNNQFPRSEALTWRDSANKKYDELKREESVTRARLDEVKKEVASIAESRTEEAGYESVKGKHLKLLAKREDQLAYSLRNLEQTLSLYFRFISELNEKVGGFDVVTSASTAWIAIQKVWNYELLVTSDDQSVTVKKIFLGLILLIVGYFLSKLLSRIFAARVLGRFRLTEGVVAALQSVTFYFLILCFTLIALRMVNVPLTIFTVLGGALAIGVGFGSQNLVNNFISGLILFTERPIKVGDLIEVDGTAGTVKQIGARSTTVRTSSNIDIIVPNSSFLEKNVVNWTRHDANVRLKVVVGVVYGSPTDLVTKLLYESVDGTHDKLLKHPEPVVLFKDFGDNALIFEVHYWARIVSQMERQIIESSVRYKIDELFRVNNIVIAFPQRDVHLNSVSPLEIRVMREQRHVGNK